MVLSATCALEALPARAEELLALAGETSDPGGVHAVELVVPVADAAELDALVAPLRAITPANGAPRFTLTAVTNDGRVTISGEVEHRSGAELIEEVLFRILGVMEVDNQVTWIYDDSEEIHKEIRK